jgi:hypothetical protein
MQSTDQASLTKEAKAFTHYLLGEQADELTISLYLQAHNKLNIVLTEKENKQLGFILRHPILIGMIDGALALRNPDSGIRKKIYVLFAILEANPKYAKYFLPSGKTTMLSIFASGIRAIWNTLTGLILLPWI